MICNVYSTYRYGPHVVVVLQAIKNNDCEKSQVTAWKAVCPLVNALNTYYQYSIELVLTVAVANLR